MRKAIIAGLMAAILLPAAAQAQTGELRRDRQDIRQEQRDLNPTAINVFGRVPTYHR